MIDQPPCCGTQGAPRPPRTDRALDRIAHTSRTSRTPRTFALLACASFWLGGPAINAAQPEPEDALSPVFVNDDPTASESLAQLTELLAAQRVDQAVRLVRELLDRHAESLVPSPGDATVHVPVRARVHALLRSPAGAGLLAAYREQASIDAEALLASGSPADLERLERQCLLTPAGLQATLELAQRHFLSGRFPLAARTLAQVQDHPDLRAQARARAAQIARDLDLAWPDARAKALVEALNDAPAAPAPRAVAAPEAPARSGLDPTPPTTLVDLVPRPMFKADFGPPIEIEIYQTSRTSPASRDLPPYARALRTMPVLAGPLAIVSSGRDVVAVDTRTFKEAWRLDLVPALNLTESSSELLQRPQPGEIRRMATTDYEDLSLVHVGPADLGIVTLTVGEGRWRDAADIVTGFDASTGRVRWSLSLDQIDPGFMDLRVRGPVLIDNDTAVLCCRKWQPDRRLSALYLVAIDTFTGAPRWTRLVGSAGAMPYPRSPLVTDGGLLEDGVVYRSDRLGVLGAYEAYTGRALWVRRLPPEPVQGEQGSWPWQMSLPVMHEGALYVLAPDRQQVMKVDAASGALVGTASAGALGEPKYLLKSGETLVCVGDNRLAMIEFAEFGRAGAAARLTPPLDAPGIRGRVMVSGDRLLVPVLSPASGVLIVDPRRPQREAMRLVRLDEPGLLLTLPDRLLVVDDAHVMGYVRWDEAENILSDLATAKPDDAEPRVRLAEFAYSAGRAPALEASVKEAAAILARGGAGGAGADSGGNEALRVRLVSGVLGMLDATLGEDGGPAARGARVPIEGERPPALPEEMPARLLAVLEPVASSADERATRQMLLAMDHERMHRPREAAGALQAILSTPDLRAASFRTARAVAPAAGEATQRLQALVRSAGPEVYDAFERELADRRAALATPTPSELEALAAVYPVAQGAPALWLEAAKAQTEQPRARLLALEQGLRAARRGGHAPAPVVGELAGTLIATFRERGLLTAAAQQLERLHTQHPGIAPTREGRALGAAELQGLQDHLRSVQRRPDLGLPAPGAAGVQTLKGWALAEPLIDEPAGKPANFFVLTTAEGDVALAAPGPGDRRGQVVMRGRVSLGKEAFAQLVVADALGATLLVTSGDDSARLIRVNLDDPDATPAWRTEPFASRFKRDDERRRGVRRPDLIVTPIGERPVSELIVCAGEQAIVLAQRSGQVSSYDPRTGEVLFSAQIDLPRVYTATIVGGTLVLAGQRDVKRQENTDPDPEPTLVFVDVRTGEVQRTLANPGQDAGAGEPGGNVRWMKPTDRGDLILGLETAVIALDPARPSPAAWAIRDPEVRAAPSAWLVGDRLVLEDEARRLWMVDALSGAVLAGPIEARERLNSSTPVLASRVVDAGDRAGGGPGELIALRSGQGVLVLSPEGEVVGVDSVSAGDDDLLVPVPTRTGFVAVSSSRANLGADIGIGYRLFTLDGPSGAVADFRRLPLPTEPLRIDAVDGLIGITCAHSTIIIPAPPSK